MPLYPSSRRNQRSGIPGIQPPEYWWQRILLHFDHISDQLEDIGIKVRKIMALVSIEQTELDNIAATV